MKQKSKKEIIKFMEDNRKNSFIFDAALAGMKTYKLPIEVIIKHILIYQFTQISTLKEILDDIK